MSRLIVKNIPKNFGEKEIKDHFKQFKQDITDCKIVRNEKGQSRKFAFLGFKDAKKAKQVKSNFHNTFLGASKIQVDFAKLKDQALNPRQNRAQKTNQKPEQAAKKFNEYKNLVKQGFKKSWQDVITPQAQKNNMIQQTKQNPMEQRKISKKEALKEKKIQKDIETLKKQVKPIKPLNLSQKNKKYLNRPLDVDQSRLYITNLPYYLEEAQFKKAFQRFGTVSKIKLPRQYDGKTKGFGFITFEKSEEAMRAFSQLDGKVLFGRIIGVKPALQDVGQIIRTGKEADFEERIKEKYGSGLDEKTSYKKKKKREMRQKLNDTTNWNTLFLNPNTILERMSRKLKVTKSQILLSQNLAPKVALAETQVIQETKQWMKKEKLNLEFLEKDRSLCERSQKVLLVKNLNYRIKQKQLRQLFEFYGIVQKVLLAPNKALAIVEFQNSQFAQNAFQKLQYHKFKNNFIYLQYAPVGMLSEESLQKKVQQIEEQIQNQEQISKVVYVKNLNFETEDSSFWETFEAIGPLKYAKIVRSRQGTSMGYGFVEFEKKEDAQKALKNLQNKILDGHKLILSMSRKKAQNVEKLKKIKQKIEKQPTEQKNTKLSIKNLAFQATKKELEQIFRQYGSVKTIRLPKKMDGSHRGFAFVQYDNIQDAALAKEALSSTHLYGRKLVIQYERGTSSAKLK